MGAHGGACIIKGNQEPFPESTPLKSGPVRSLFRVHGVAALAGKSQSQDRMPDRSQRIHWCDSQRFASPLCPPRRSWSRPIRTSNQQRCFVETSLEGERILWLQVQG